MEQTLKILPGPITQKYTSEVVALGSVFKDADGNVYRFVQSYEADVATVGQISHGMALHYKDGDISQVSKAGGHLNDFAGICMVDTDTNGVVADDEYFFVLIKGMYAECDLADGVADGDALYAEATNASLLQITDATLQVPIAYAREGNATGSVAEGAATILGAGA